MRDAFVDLVAMIAHEAGHAVAAEASPCVSAPQSIEIKPGEGSATCSALCLEQPSSLTACLELASFSLGGAAGETVAFGGFEKLHGPDLLDALETAKLARQLTGAPRRRPRIMSAFLRKMPQDVFWEYWAFLERSYDLAVERIRQRRLAHRQLRNLITFGYCHGKLNYGAEEIGACLHPEA